MSLQSHYPTSCPFCKISAAYPPSPTSPIPHSPDPERIDPQCHLILSTPHVMAFLDILPISPGHILLTTRSHYEKLSNVPSAPTPTPSSQSPTLWQNKPIDEGATPAAALGFWMPILSRALARSLDIEDWNIVQNNGARAAQVVPHVHFHYIPRYPEGRVENKRKGNVDVGMLKSWRMFGRGTREELDDEEAVGLSRRIREGLAVEVEEVVKGRGRSKSRL